MRAASVLGVILALGGWQSAWADVSTEVYSWRQAHTRLELDSREVPVLERKTTGRDNTILRVEAVVRTLLEESDITDAKAPLGPSCGAKEGCVDTFGLPEQEGLANWQDGFVAEDVVTFRANAKDGDTRSEKGVRYLESEDGTLIERAGVFGLRIFAGGDAFRFVNELNGYHKLQNAEVTMSNEEVVARGRALIDELQLVEMGPDEELKLFKTEFVRFTGKAADPGERVVAVIVTFGRTFRGIPVIGKMGSTVSIEFIANGNVHRLAVDWSPLAPSTKVTRFAGGQTILERIADRSLRDGTSKSGVASASLPSGELICGYLDEEARSVGASREISLGCLVNDLESAQRYVVPADENVLPLPGFTGRRGSSLLALGDPVGGGPLAEPEVVVHREPAPQASGGCALAPAGSAPTGLVGLGLGVAMLAMSSRRRSRGRKRLERFIWGMGLVFLSLYATDGYAAYYSTLMNRTYDNDPSTGQPWQSNFNSVQWENYVDWVDEMDDIATRSADMQGDFDLCLHHQSQFNNLTYDGDLLAVTTHGSFGTGSDLTFEGVGAGKSFNTWMYSHLIGPNSENFGETEIAMFGLCSFFSQYTNHQWYGFRNLFRGGITVATGCWGAAGAGTCSITTTSTNSTWNEAGDSIADSEQSIWGTWKDAHAVSTASDQIIVFGSGKKSAGDCSTRASGVKFQNRHNFTDYTFGWDEPETGSFEVCGYLIANW